MLIENLVRLSVRTVAAAAVAVTIAVVNAFFPLLDDDPSGHRYDDRFSFVIEAPNPRVSSDFHPSYSVHERNVPKTGILGQPYTL